MKEHMRLVIEKIGYTVATPRPDASVYLRRSFCIFECVASALGGAELQIVAPGEFGDGWKPETHFQKIRDELLTTVDVVEAQTRNPEDKKAIDAYAAEIGTARINSIIIEAMVKCHRDRDAVDAMVMR